MNNLNDFFNNCHPILSILVAVFILLLLGGICILIAPILKVLSYVMLYAGVLMIVLWIIRTIINIFK